jgi:hypothetical protein
MTENTEQPTPRPVLPLGPGPDNRPPAPEIHLVAPGIIFQA